MTSSTEELVADAERAAGEGDTAFRPATLDDVDAIFEIEQHSFPNPWPRSVLAAEISKRNWSRVVIATRGGELVGYLVYWVILTEVHLLNLAVAPAWRCWQCVCRVGSTGTMQIGAWPRVCSCRQPYAQQGYQSAIICDSQALG